MTQKNPFTYTLSSYFEGCDGFAKGLDNFSEIEMTRFTEYVANHSPAEILQTTLQAGLMEELGWNAYDELLDEQQWNPSANGNFPYLVVDRVAQKELVVLGPNGVEKRLARPNFLTPVTYQKCFIGQDILIKNDESDNFNSYWLSKPEKAVSINHERSMALGIETPKGGIFNGFATISPGASRYKAKRMTKIFFSDGKSFWDKSTEFNPDTGKDIQKDSLPLWLKEKTGTAEELLRFSSYYPVPNELSASPLGIQNGQFGARFWRENNEQSYLEDICGRFVSWNIHGSDLRYTGVPVAFLTFPGRDIPYVVFKNGDHVFVLNPQTGAQILPQWEGMVYWRQYENNVHWWHYFTPRDPNGSAALANCSTTRATSLLNGALEAAKTVTPTADANFAIDAIKKVFPEVTHPLLQLGISQVLKVAVLFNQDYRQWHRKMNPTVADVEKEKSKNQFIFKSDGVSDKTVQYVLDFFQGHSGFNREKGYFDAAVKSTMQFLHCDALADGFHALSQTNVVLPRMARQLKAVVWMLLNGAITTEQKKQIASAVAIWADMPISANPERYRIAAVVFEPGLGKASFETPTFGWVQDGHHYALFTYTDSFSSEKQDYLLIEYCKDGVFKDPNGATVLWSERYDEVGLRASDLHEMVNRFEQNGSIPFDPSIAVEIARDTGLSQKSAALIWKGAFFEEQIDRSFLKELKVTRSDEELASYESGQRFDKNQNIVPKWYLSFDQRRDLFCKLFPPKGMMIFAPTQSESDNPSAVDHFIDVWKKEVGVRRPLDTEQTALVERLKSDFQDPHGHYYYDVRILEDPAAFDGLATDEKWVIRPFDSFVNQDAWNAGYVPEGWPKFVTQDYTDFFVKHPDQNLAFTDSMFKRFIRLMAWFHLEMPVHFAQKEALVKTAQLIEQRLSNPDLLMLVGAVSLGDVKKENLEAEFNKLVRDYQGKSYTAVDGRDAAEGYDRGDLVVTWPKENKNGIFISFRPAMIKSDDALLKIATELGVYDLFKKGKSFCACGLNFGRNYTPNLSALPHFHHWRSKGFQEIVSLFQSTEKDTTRFYANPQYSVPSLVASVSSALELDENATSLFLQLITLPDPSMERVLRYNNWKTADYKKAQMALSKKKLVVEKKITRVNRSTFVTPWLQEGLDHPSPPAVPMEKLKTALYELEYDAKGRPDVPYKLVLPHKPLPVLFEGAWAQYQNLVK